MIESKGGIDLAPSLGYDSGAGFRIDGSAVQFWAKKSQATAAAKTIGWPVLSVRKVHTRFQIGYALMSTFGGFVSRAGFAAVVASKRGAS